MTDLQELYQQVILDHNKSPRNFGALENAASAEGFNPLCGDSIKLYLVVNDGMVEDLRFEGSGCAISKASASIMTTLVKGKSVSEAQKMFDVFHNLVTEGADAGNDSVELGKMAVFEGVREFPARVKCASLAWHTLHNALLGKESVASTE